MNFVPNNTSEINSFDLFHFAVVNPQIAMLTFLKMGEQMASQPDKIRDSQKELWNRLIELQTSLVEEICRKQSTDEDVIELEYNKKDQKFENNSFDSNAMMIYTRKFYDTMSDWVISTLDSFENVDPSISSGAKFFAKQYLNMMSPDNFPFLNPKVLKETLDSGGENFRKGLELFLEDLSKGRITTNDQSSFSVGENLANTPGKVVFRNDLIELIQYTPTTKTVYETPILFVPPWINKFYILDLNEKFSFVKWAVDNGFTVFMISWVNPDKRYKDYSFEDYAFLGVVKALDTIYELTKAKAAHTIGYCVGGTLISCLLAYLAHPQSKIKPKTDILSATLLTTLLDFQHAGDMSVFMSGNYLDVISAQMKEKGVLNSSVMYNTFSALKPKDMIWRYFINSYMLGKRPSAHEILFWNSDATNLTKAMQTFLSHDLYRDNLLKTGILKMGGVPLELWRINKPIYMISMIKDHLVPWQAAFDGKNLFNCPVKFVVGGSGHVAGVINHPNNKKYSYWINDKIVETAQDWINTAIEIQGSWWNDWIEWLKPMMGGMINAPQIEDFIGDAPGIYVKNMVPEQLLSKNENNS